MHMPIKLTADGRVFVTANADAGADADYMGTADLVKTMRENLLMSLTDENGNVLVKFSGAPTAEEAEQINKVYMGQEGLSDEDLQLGFVNFHTSDKENWTGDGAWYPLDTKLKKKHAADPVVARGLAVNMGLVLGEVPAETEAEETKTEAKT